MTQPTASSPESISFETAMERLEAIVDAMESGTLPLETMLQQYEEGTRMIKTCAQKLDAAQKRIEIITRNATEPFDPEAENKVSSPRTKAAKVPPKTEESDEISLF